MSDISEMIGADIVSVTGRVNGDQMVFETRDGRRFVFDHSQDCCESVSINDIIGDLDDLLGVLVIAEEVSSEGEPPADDYAESHTWTFYRFATVKGTVTVRWYGTSNGYYSEGVDFTIHRAQ